jgi:hypothetical protein
MRKIRSTLLLISILILFSACSSSGASGDSDSAMNIYSPKVIISGEVYDLYMYEDTEGEDNKNYLKFTPAQTGYYTLHLGTEDEQDLEIKIYSDDEFSSLVTYSSGDSVVGEYFTYNYKADQDYYIMIENYDNSVDVDYNLLITPSSSDGYYTKDSPMNLTLDDSDQLLLTKIGYDSSLSIFDNDEETIYIQIDSNLSRSLYINTEVLDNLQDLDIKVYADEEYSNILYQSSGVDTTSESLYVSFENDKIYYVEITNFSNDEETDLKLSISYNSINN